MHFGILSEKLRQRGHRVLTLCPRDSKTEVDLRQRNFEPANFNVRSYFHPGTVVWLSRLLKAHQVDIIHAHYSRDLWTIAPAAKLAGDVPIVLIKHIGTQKPKQDLFHRWIYKNVCYVIAISQVIAENVRCTHPISPEKVGVVHHGLDLTLFRNLEAGRKRVRNEFGFAETDIVVGTIGRLQEGKGHLEFLEMARRIAEQWPEARFLLVGESTYGERHRARAIYNKAKEINLGNCLVMPGFRNDVPDVLAAIDIFTFPSHAEAFGLVVIEAMAAGLPIISSNCDGVLDIITNGVTGMLVPPKDVDQLTNAVEILLKHPNKRMQYGRMARKEAERRFTIDKMVNQVEAVYRKCAQ